MQKKWQRIISVVLSIAVAVNLAAPAFAYELKSDKPKTLPEYTVRAENSGTDELTEHWAEQIIRKMMDKGVIKGTEEDGEIRINPDERMTRAEFVTAFVRANGIEKNDDIIDFCDTYDHWARHEIRAAVALGIVNGYPDGTFKPDDFISRAEAAKITAIFLNLQCDEQMPEFNDIDEECWANRYINACAKAGIVNGYPDGTFRASDVISRAEGIVVVSRGENIRANNSKNDDENIEEEPKNQQKSNNTLGDKSALSKPGRDKSEIGSTSSSEQGNISNDENTKSDNSEDRGGQSSTEEDSGEYFEEIEITEELSENFQRNDSDEYFKQLLRQSEEKLQETENRCQKALNQDYRRIAKNEVRLGQTEAADAEKYAWYGDGTAEAFHINTAEEMYEFAEIVNSGTTDFAGKIVFLFGDIDVSEKIWTPIGTSGNEFCGIFDGQNHKISNLKINSGSYIGLFRSLNEEGIVRNLRLENVQINGNECVGGVVADNMGIIQNCSVSGEISANGEKAGGIVGIASIGSNIVIDCVNRANVSSKNTSVGGIIGESYTIAANCENFGDISGLRYTGGIVGCGGSYGSNNGGRVYNCVNKGNVVCEKVYAGGIAGVAWGDVLNCVNTKDVVAYGEQGAIAGQIYLYNCENSYYLNQNDISAVGKNYYGKVRNCSEFDEKCLLQKSVKAGEYEGTDLLLALNGWVEAQESELYAEWQIGKDGLPELVLGRQTVQISGRGAIDELMKLDNSQRNTSSWLCDPIDLASGAQLISHSYLTQNSAIGLSINLEYNSLMSNEGLLGKGWTFNYETKLDVSNSEKITLIWSANRKNEFIRKSENEYFYNDGFGNEYILQKSDCEYVLKTPKKITYQFDLDGKLVRQTDKYGNYLEFEYSDGKLVKIADSMTGKYIAILYSDGMISRFEGADGTSIEVKYTDGIITEITDELNNVREYTYNGKNQVLTGRLNGTLVFENTYDKYGRIITQDDGIDGNLVSRISYDEDSLPGFIITTVTDRNGNSQTRIHDKNYRLVEVADALGATVYYDYDEKGNMIETADSLGRTSQYEYDDRGNTIKITDTMGNAVVMEYDDDDNLVKTTSAYGAVNRYEYGVNGELLSVTDEEGNITKYQYNENGLPISSEAANGAVSRIVYNEDGTVNYTEDAAGVRTYYEYYANGRTAAVLDENGNGVRYKYDAKGQIIEMSDAFGDKVAYEYDAWGNMIRSTDPNGNATTYEYDLNNNVTKHTDALGNTTTYEYDGEGRLVAATDALGNRTETEFDAVGNVIGITDALGNSTTYEYDEGYRVCAVYDAKNVCVARYEYDDYDNIVKITDARGNSEKYEYDKFGKLISSVNPLDNATYYEYDVKGRLIEVTDALGAKSSVAYDNVGNITEISGQNGTTASCIYDTASRLVGQSTINGNSIGYKYNGLGRLETVTNARGQRTVFDYDIAGQIHKISRPDGNEISYKYDNVGNLTKISDDNGEIRREYDELGRVTSYTDASGNCLRYTYDANGNLTSITYPDGKTVEYGYNCVNQLETVTDWNGRQTSYAYDENGLLISIIRPNGTKLENIYNKLGKLVNQIDSNAITGEVIYEASFAYDKAGNIIEENTTAEVIPPIAEEIRMSYGEGNVLLSVNGENVTADNDGNITELPLPNGTMHLEYDCDNKLVKADDCEYTYDAENNRIAASYYGEVTKYVINPSSLSQTLVRTKANGETAYYVYGLGLIGQYADDGYKTYHFDVRGSTVAITDENGTVTDTFAYDAYGGTIGRTGTTDTPFRYCGQYGIMTEPNGLLYMRARYYSPTICRFVSQDSVVGSISDSSSLNRYAFCGGNPVMYVDPTGHFAESALDYTGRSLKQCILGAYSGETTLLGTAGQMILGTLGLDFHLDIIDLTYSLQNFDGSVGSYFDVALGLCAFIPVIGSVKCLKNVDNVVDAGKAINKIDNVADAAKAINKVNPNFSRKMEYIFGNATGSKHNIDRSLAMERQLNSIGIFDNTQGRKMVTDNLTKAFNNSSSISKIQDNGRVVRESLLAGYNGVVKIESIWQNEKLITVEIFGGR